MSLDETLNLILDIYYPIYFGICLSFQFLLFLLIFVKTTQFVNTFKVFLFLSNVCNFILSALAFGVQVRTVNNSQSLAVIGRGPCNLVNRELCFDFYVSLLAMTCVCGLLNLHSLYYKMITCKFYDRKVVHFRIRLFCFHYFLPIVVVILSYIPEQNNDFVYAETLKMHPDVGLQYSEKFGGFLNSHHICQALVTIILVFMTVYAPVVGFYWRQKTLHILELNEKSLSLRSINQFKILIRGLGFQILVPLFCYLPIGFCFVYNKYSGSSIWVSQHLLGVFITFPALIDPILSIYFVIPYRKTVKNMLWCHSIPTMFATSHVSAVSHPLQIYNEHVVLPNRTIFSYHF